MRTNGKISDTAFYAIKAVLALKDIDFKRHKDVVAYFNRHYVATELIPKDTNCEKCGIDYVVSFMTKYF